MTIHIKQRSNNDCVLASIAMAVGASSWEDAWTEEDLKEVIESHGISDFAPWFARHHVEEWKDYRHIYVNSGNMGVVKALLWQRRAILSTNSLNNDGGSHAVYWDGTKVYDPQEGVEGKLAYRFLSSMVLTNAYVFKD